ncbi:probable fructokinase-7 [Impatiens glandulifera]|uniref:probable fructokinase-7 n=1 Tax=Impatiens glandulifera TaxID=253017 RepID=UPI001FB1440C|nr:probable fructokinase-7 [Impatiens glandulifera]
MVESSDKKKINSFNCCFPVDHDRSFRNSFRSSRSNSDKISKITRSISTGSSEDLIVRKGVFNEKRKPLVVCFGEMLIDFVPTVAGVSLAEAPAFRKAPGGAPANVAVGIARLGGSSAFIGKVGDDEFGHMLADILKQNNVDNSGLRFDQIARTGLAFVTLRADGEREFTFYRNPSADTLLSEADLDKSLIKKGTIFHYGSISLISEPCKSAHLAAMEIARDSGCILSYDPNLRLPLWPSEKTAREGIMSIWNQADIIKVSEEEVEFLTEGGDAFDDDLVLKKLYHLNLKLLIVTQGSNGCRYYTKGFKGRVSSKKVVAVDTTGAGDAFVGALLNSLAADSDCYMDEEKLKEVLKFANGCGALTATEKGAIPALPTKDRVLQFLENSPNI